MKIKMTTIYSKHYIRIEIDWLSFIRVKSYFCVCSMRSLIRAKTLFSISLQVWLFKWVNMIDKVNIWVLQYKKINIIIMLIKKINVIHIYLNKSTVLGIKDLPSGLGLTFFFNHILFNKNMGIVYLLKRKSSLTWAWYRLSHKPVGWTDLFSSLIVR